jgi:hypothetical protein
MVSCQKVEDALVRRAGIPRDAFSVHSYMPEDFLVVFASEQFRDQVASRPSLLTENFSLFFRRWTRLATAQRVVAQSKVHLAIEGIPPHAWDRSTAEHLLGTSCALTELAPETASRADLGLFKGMAWTRSLESIPPVRLLWVPEPDEGVPLAGPQPLQRIQELGLLEYRILIHVTRVEEYITMEGPTWARRSPGSDQSGLPSQDSLEDGFWTTRNLPWSSGSPDPRGRFSGNGGGGAGNGGGGS